jgi:Recombination enhancement, RecA-dependent nuclease
MTKAERNHYDKICQFGCIACHVLNYGFSPCEIHHIRTGTGKGQKAHYSKAIGLCALHHRLGGLGVAIHAGIKSFEANIGMTELELLEKQIKVLN